MDYDFKWTFPSLLSDLDKRDYTFRVHVLVSGPQQVTANHMPLLALYLARFEAHVGVGSSRSDQIK